VVETPKVAVIRVTVTLPRGTITCRGRLYHCRIRQVLQVVSRSEAFAHASGLCTATSAPENRYGANALNLYMLQIPGRVGGYATVTPDGGTLVSCLKRNVAGLPIFRRPLFCRKRMPLAAAFGGEDVSYTEGFRRTVRRRSYRRCR